MDVNRNQFMLIGLLLLLLGLQLRFVDTFVLSEGSTRFLAKRTAQAEPVSNPWNWPVALAAQSPIPMQRKRIRHPRWLAYALISVGVVLMLHSLAMKKPGT